MGEIRLLPDDVKSRIAAGEVIERPASVVKELVENALDAGATRVRIDLSDGGIRRIRVVDDGKGIAWEDLPLAVAAHATSKLRTVEDLDAIGTLGFRGEALASIGAVARLDLSSRARGAPSGGRIRVEGGRIYGPEPVGTPEGTIVEVRDLFFNLPARRKFLRATAAELAAVTEWIHRIAVVSPHAALSLTHDGRAVLELPAQEGEGRLAELFGGELADALCPVAFDAAGVRVEGWVARPSLHRPDRRWMLLSVGGRPVRDRVLWGAVSAATETYVPRGRHPAAFLDVRVDPSRLDVNVHPAKYEVRFRDAAAVRGAIIRAIREALAGAGVAAACGTDPHVHGASSHGHGGAGAGFLAEGEGDPFGPPSPSAGRALPDDLLPGMDRPFAGRTVQLHDAYLVTEHPEGIEVIDPHALHERILYDRMRQAAREAPLTTQAFAVPHEIEFDRAQVEMLRGLEPLLAAVGIAVRAVEGESRIAVSEAPASLTGARLRGFFERLLEEASQDGGVPDAAALRERVVRIAACQSAVRFGDRLAPGEIAALLAERREGTFHLACQHGRPTSWIIPHAELDRRFQRSGGVKAASKSDADPE